MLSKKQNDSIRHIGPMAQDFCAAFEVGHDDKRISTIDADGVALASIQALYQLVKEKDVQTLPQKPDSAALGALQKVSVK